MSLPTCAQFICLAVPLFVLLPAILSRFVVIAFFGLLPYSRVPFQLPPHCAYATLSTSLLAFE